MKRFIYQIGRPDKNVVNFTYENKTYTKPLSSLVLKEHFGVDVKVILIYPISIILYNEKVLEDLKDDGVDGFIKVHSFGTYKKPADSESITFNSHYDDIVLRILCDLIKRYFEVSKVESEFYFDISSGLNIHISAMIEAVRHFSVFTQLMNWQNKNFIPKIFISFSDPILPQKEESSDKKYRIYIQPLNFKAFFLSPLKKEDITGENKLSKKLFPDVDDENQMKENRRKRKILENFVIFFSALRNNTPLVLYHFESDKYEDIIQAIKDLTNEIETKLSQNWENSPNLPKNDYLKAIFSLGFYAGIVEVLDKNLKKCSDGVEICEIKNKFGSYESSIYRFFGLETHIPLLGNELYNLEEGYKVDGKKLVEIVGEEWSKLMSFVRGEKQDFDERNFFSHAGFERTITEIRSKDKKLYFKYSENAEDKIKSVLLKYIGD
jgi:CRISPR-associated protein Csx1